MKRLVDYFETDLNRIVEIVIAMPDGEHKTEFLQVN